MIHDIRTYKPTAGDKFLVDTNVWLFLHCPLGNHRQQVVAQYSKFYKDIVSAKSQILICSSVVCEFLNRYVKLDFELQRSMNSAIQEFKKTYRPTPNYIATVKQAATAMNKKILPHCSKLHDKFDVISIENIFGHMEHVDVSDGYMFEMVCGNGIKVLTDDSDFGAFKDKCDIYTSNPRLLAMN
jgi:predicted nucleic acid-binding protein